MRVTRGMSWPDWTRCQTPWQLKRTTQRDASIRHTSPHARNSTPSRKNSLQCRLENNQCCIWSTVRWQRSCGTDWWVSMNKNPSIHMLQQKWYSAMLKPSDDVAAHIARLGDVAHRLKLMGVDMKDSMVVTKILMTLLEACTHFVSAWESTGVPLRTQRRGRQDTRSAVEPWKP